MTPVLVFRKRGTEWRRPDSTRPGLTRPVRPEWSYQGTLAVPISSALLDTNWRLCEEITGAALAEVAPWDWWR